MLDGAVFIIEGVAGVVVPQQGQPGNVEYERARRLMTEEVSAAIAGATSSIPAVRRVSRDSSVAAMRGSLWGRARRCDDPIHAAKGPQQANHMGDSKSDRAK